MAKYTITVNGKQYDVEIGDVSASPITVNVNGAAYNVQWARGQALPTPAQPVVAAPVVQTKAPAPAPAAPVAPSGKGELVSITAPMPGKILKVMVAAGDTVADQQPLCTLEAMKMESAIQSTTAGKVISVNVSAGDAVQYGAVLVVLEKQGE